MTNMFVKADVFLRNKNRNNLEQKRNIVILESVGFEDLGNLKLLSWQTHEILGAAHQG